MLLHLFPGHQQLSSPKMCSGPCFLCGLMKVALSLGFLPPFLSLPASAASPILSSHLITHIQADFPVPAWILTPAAQPHFLMAFSVSHQTSVFLFPLLHGGNRSVILWSHCRPFLFLIPEQSPPKRVLCGAGGTWSWDAAGGQQTLLVPQQWPGLCLQP